MQCGCPCGGSTEQRAPAPEAHRQGSEKTRCARRTNRAKCPWPSARPCNVRRHGPCSCRAKPGPASALPLQAPPRRAASTGGPTSAWARGGRQSEKRLPQPARGLKGLKQQHSRRGMQQGQDKAQNAAKEKSPSAAGSRHKQRPVSGDHSGPSPQRAANPADGPAPHDRAWPRQGQPRSDPRALGAHGGTGTQSLRWSHLCTGSSTRYVAAHAAARTASIATTLSPGENDPGPQLEPFAQAHHAQTGYCKQNTPYEKEPNCCSGQEHKKVTM
mmetsp:Transcript_37995/g.114856  ORF Transcript_37995/g.114856 Transcript_37995/m.114856 type:complete len:272 (-) Transcript_37995:464-1279(-)